MMRRSLTGLALMLALCPSPGAAATLSLAAKRDANTRLMDRYFECLAALEPAKSRAAVRDSGAPGQLDQGASICLRSAGAGEMITGEALYRAGLARAVYARTYRDGLPKVGDAPAPDASADAAWFSVSSDKATAAMMLFTRCVAAAAPVASDAFVRAIPGSLYERTQLELIQPNFANCLTVAPQMVMDRQGLREYLGLALYMRTPDYRRAN